MKKIIALLFALALVLPITMVYADDTVSFQATITKTTDKIEVTISDAYANYAPTIAVEYGSLTNPVITDPNGKTVSATVVDGEVSFTASVSGTYTIKAGATGGSGGGYRLPVTGID